MVVVFIFLIFQNIIERFIPSLSYFDETFLFIGIVAIMMKVISTKKASKINIKIITLLIFLLLIGAISTIVYRIQLNPLAITKDIVAVSKAFITFVFIKSYFPKGISLKDFNYIAKFSKIYTVILFVFMIISQIVSTGMTIDKRWIFESYRFLYSHPTFLVSNAVVISSILIADKKNNNIYIILQFIIIISAMRSKGFIYIIITATFLMFFRNKKNMTFNDKYLIAVITMIGIILATFLSKERIDEYLNWGLTAARPALYIVGTQIMLNNFPLGSGFVSFASSLSGEYYSSLYYEYNLSGVNGLEQELGFGYISDTYWPYIVAQFGLLGTVIYIRILYIIFKDCIIKVSENFNALISMLGIISYIIFSSFVESIFTNANIILFILTIAYYLNYNEKEVDFE